jgi:hypothetical protein
MVPWLSSFGIDPDLSLERVEAAPTLGATGISGFRGPEISVSRNGQSAT